MSRFEVVITDSAHPDGKLEQEILGDIGAEVKKFQTYDEEEILKITRTADGTICEFAPIKRRVISNLERARVIVEYGVGYDNIDVQAATEKGIVVCNVPDYTTFEVADHTLALILAMARRVTWADSLARGGDWTRYGAWAWSKLMPMIHVDGRVAGVIGFGRIGRQVAERLQAFHLKVLAYDPFVPKDVGAKMNVELVDLPTLLTESDIISINALLSDQSYHMIGDDQLRLMKKTSFIVNTARGKIIDQSALVKALREGRIGGAALDVLEKEPPDEDDPILKLGNVIITSHLGGYSDKAVTDLRRLGSEEVARVLRGQPPKHPIAAIAKVK
jgi:D-3-phosphoglycerate dehydrogenase